MNKKLFKSSEIRITVDPGVIIIKIVKNVIAQSLVSLVSYEIIEGSYLFVRKEYSLIMLMLDVIN